MLKKLIRTLVILLGCLLLWVPFAALEFQPILRHFYEPSVVRVGDDFVLRCEVSGPYGDNVTWTLNGSRLDDYSNLTTLSDEGDPNVTVARMHFTSAQLHHSGNYTCHVGSANSSVFLSISSFELTPLTVRLVPWVVVTLGKRVVLNCTIHGHPLPSSVLWMKDDVRVESSETINVSQRVINASEIMSTLEIFNVTESHLGAYDCSPNSSHTRIHRTTNVVDKGLSPPSNVSVVFLNPQSLELRWFAFTRDVPIDEYRIQVWESSGVLLRRVVVHHKLSYKLYFQVQTQKIHDLRPGVSYFFKISSCNHDVGCSNESWSDNITLPGYSSPPQNVQLTCHYDNISRGSFIDAKWEEPADPQSQILYYRIRVLGSASYINGHGVVASEPEAVEVHKNQTWVKIPVNVNTNYSLQVCAVTSVGCGLYNNILDSNCSTPPTLPNKLPNFTLRNVEATESCCKLKLNMKRISQRNGPIKCYRIILYKMKTGKQKIPAPDFIDLLSYDEVHKESSYGAYVAEAFNGEKYQAEVILGDDEQSRCGSRPETRRGSRSIIIDTDEDDTEIVHDGELAAETYYTGFVEVKVIGKDNTVLTKRSSLFMQIKTGSNNYGIQATALGVICGLVIVIIILAVALCALSKRNSIHDYDGSYNLCSFCGPIAWSRSAGMAGMPVLPPPDLKPLKPENLPTAFQERHKDSDLLFQREFEALPEAFRDRTTNASDMVENFFKNRYPDIKAYDQTRVKLSPLDGIAGSDYINANHVVGYKERKKFICAQGPLEKTVNDFWRMIWEQKVTIVVMVTCLEENGKKKCTKYWPDEDESQFGNLTVTLENCRVCSDYVIRKLTVSLKKEEGVSETRDVLHYHYLTWKDFLAPEHPGGILKFIKRINEVYSPDKGPILIHCSAGVGRTGTLVVIDSLLQQMKDEGQVEIFNFVVGVRRHRNFLVQSLKQYIFIYRALMEFTQFGDTELRVSSLATQYNQLCTQIKSGKSALKAEYEKLNQIIEDQKTSDVATMDVNINKNRFPTVVPYDRNRVILTPVPSREHSSYINASYVQGFDRACSFIITQDPMEASVNEFWRMAFEQNSSSVIMLSVNSDPQYWPNEEEEYDHFTVTLQTTEELDHFTKRQFDIVNTKSSKSHSVSQYHFSKWTSEVPSDTAPIIELVKALNFKPANAEDTDNPVIVHCREAGQHSAVFVACCILALQIEHEQQIDVFQLVRNLRSQRSGLFQNFESYKFCYQFALDYSNTVNSDSTDVA